MIKLTDTQRRLEAERERKEEGRIQMITKKVVARIRTAGMYKTFGKWRDMVREVRHYRKVVKKCEY